MFAEGGYGRSERFRAQRTPHRPAAPSRNQSNIHSRLGVSYEDPGQAIALDFVGLSYESAILTGGDYLIPTNASMLGLIRSLSVNGVIRIGGSTSERTV